MLYTNPLSESIGRYVYMSISMPYMFTPSGDRDKGRAGPLLHQHLARQSADPPNTHLLPSDLHLHALITKQIPRHTILDLPLVGAHLAALLHLQQGARLLHCLAPQALLAPLFTCHA